MGAATLPQVRQKSVFVMRVVETWGVGLTVWVMDVTGTALVIAARCMEITTKTMARPRPQPAAYAMATTRDADGPWHRRAPCSQLKPRARAVSYSPSAGCSWAHFNRCLQ